MLTETSGYVVPADIFVLSLGPTATVLAPRLSRGGAGQAKSHRHRPPREQLPNRLPRCRPPRTPAHDTERWSSLAAGERSEPVTGLRLSR
jgi:hypothetical protein